MQVFVRVDDEQINRREARGAGDDVFAVCIKGRCAVAGAKIRDRVAPPRDHARHFREAERGHEHGDFSRCRVAPADDGLRGDDGRLRPGDDADDADVVAEDLIENDEPFEVFERCGLPHEWQAEVSLRAFADVKIRADGHAEAARDFHDHALLTVEIDRVLGTATLDAA